MSYYKNKSTEVRKSPVQYSSKVSKPKVHKNKASKPGEKSLSNGFHGKPNEVVFAKNSNGEDEVTKINLMTLQKVDSSISDIQATVPHVVLYQYQSEQDMWERTSYEGTLFVYQRDSEMEPGFMILNKLSNDNIWEAIKPEMEFRLQTPFILYGKQSGTIYGLCIQDKERCTEIGNLLNSLSKGAVSPKAHLRTSGDPTVSPQSLRSQSPEGSAESQGIKPTGDALEVSEIAGQSYLGGQCFSDDTDSHDETRTHSPPGEGMASTTNSLFLVSMSPPDESSQIPTSRKQNQQHLTSSSFGLSLNSRGFQEFSPRATSPKQIPTTQQRGVSSDDHHHTLSHGHQAISSSQSHMKQSRSPKFRQKQDHYASSPPNSVPRSRHGQMQHAASFDQIKFKQGLREVGAYTESRSNSLFEGSPYMTTPTNQHYYSAQIPSRTQSAAANMSMDNSIVRKLFESDTEPTTSRSLSIETLFSQTAEANLVRTHQTSSGNLYGKLNKHPQGLLPPAFSLDEVEKQMKEEASGIEDSKPTSGQISNSRDNGKQTSQVPSSNKTVLLQPSAFATVSPSISTTISVEPPSPVVCLPAASKAQVFPSIPPLMHSAGMTAPPLVSGSTSVLDSTSVYSAHKSKWQSQAAQSIQTAIPKEMAEHVPITTAHEPQTPPRINSDPLNTISKSSVDELPIPGRSVTAPSTLMSPQQFTISREETKTAESGKGKGPEVNLTRDQMQQALLYLIQHDSSFMDKLHEAYKMSIATRQV